MQNDLLALGLCRTNRKEGPSGRCVRTLTTDEIFVVKQSTALLMNFSAKFGKPQKVRVIIKRLT